MFNNRNGLNYWPSFVDGLVVLFIITLIVYIFSIVPKLNKKPEIKVKPYNVLISEKEPLILEYSIINYYGDCKKDVKIIKNDLPESKIIKKLNKIIVQPQDNNKMQYNKQYNPYLTVTNSLGLTDSVLVPVIIKKFEPSRFQPKGEYLFVVKIKDYNLFTIGSVPFNSYETIRDIYKDDIAKAKSKGCVNAIKVVPDGDIDINTYISALKKFKRDFYTYQYRE